MKIRYYSILLLLLFLVFLLSSHNSRGQKIIPKISDSENKNGLAKNTDNYGVIDRNTVSTTKLFTIYPNPVKDYLNIDLKDNYKIVSYSIYDILGKKIKFSLKIDNNTIRVSELNSGIHIIKIKTTEGEFSTKFIKE